MKRFVAGQDRSQSTLFPERLDNFIADDNPVRAIDVFVDELDMAALGFDGALAAETGRPSYHPATLLKIYIYAYNGVLAGIFKRRALSAGLDPEQIWGHSTRVGAAQDLLAANCSGAELVRQGRWKFERMIVRGGERLSAGHGAVALLKSRKPRDPED